MPYTFTIGNTRHENKTADETQHILRNFSHIVDIEIQNEIQSLLEYLRLQVEYPVVSAVVSIFTTARPPQAIEFAPITARFRQATTNTSNGNFTLALQDFEFVTNELERIHERLALCRDGSITGAERAITVLEFVVAGSAVTVGIVAGLPAAAGGLALEGVAAASVTAGYGAVTSTARQASEVSYNIRDRIDWTGIAIDTISSTILNYFGGRLAAKIASRLALSPAILALEEAERRAVTSTTERILSNEVIRNAVAAVLVNRGAGVVQLIIRNTIDFYRAPSAAARPTWDTVLNQLADNFSASQIFFDLVSAEISRRNPSSTNAPTASIHH